MLSIVTGPFHPDLEAALVSQVRSLKENNPLAPLAIIVPSRQLALRVKRLLAVEQGLTLLDVHVLTFHQLAVTLIRDGGPAEPPDLVDGSFREALLRVLVARGVSGSDVFRDWSGMRGIWSALWMTIQDLKEARVDPASALTALEEGHLDGDDPTRLAALLRLYAAVLEADRALRIADPDDLATHAVEVIPESRFLKRMRGVCYYGFYDLTQGQLDLFKAVAAACPTTVFFPLRDCPAYRFARRFFETHIQGLALPLTQPSLQRGEGKGEGALVDEIAPEVRSGCRVLSAVGPDDEVSAVAKEVLHLIEERGFDPMEIGVVARDLDAILPFVRRVFDENRIPYACPAGEPLIHEPLVKAIVRFVGLPASSFSRADVIEVLTSPGFRLDAVLALASPEPAPRPDMWDWITRRLGITRGDPENGALGEWLRLEQAARQGLTVPGEERNDYPDRVIAAEQLGLLWRAVKRLHGDLSALPARAGWGEYTAAFARLLPTYFDLPAWEGAAPAEHGERVQRAIRDCLASLTRLEVLDESISPVEWGEHLVRVMERTLAPSESIDQPGVQVLDAMDARGIPFRALFVLGLNEKVFPRSIREDAFLRDADREVLARDLGFKIARKLDGFDEERLLCALLLRSARERLYLSYQRADRNGRAMVPSGYLAELAESGASSRERRIKRRPTERWAEWPYDWRLLTPREAGLRLILDEARAEGARLHAASELLEEGLKALARIDATTPTLTPHDGLAGPGLAHWCRLERDGASPTALERYARCPFQYFAAHVLRLQPLEAPESVVEIDARSRGELCHEILRTFFARLQRAGCSLAEVDSSEARQWLAEEAAGAFARHEQEQSVGYPLVWALAKEEIARLVERFVQADLADLRETGYVPTLFEVPATGRFGHELPEDLRHVPIRGRLDRVDVKRADGKAHVRVVDYKYTQARALKPADRDLATAAARGFRLQPPLYLLAARNVLDQEPAIPETVAFYFLAPNLPDGPLTRSALGASCWEGETGARIGDTVRRMLDGIRAGRFFIFPGDYCDHCDFSSVCRRTHDPSKRRARGDERTKTLERLRALQLPAPSTGAEEGRKRNG
jgi:ATP-dependent helicase/nuclease subunit B